MQKDKNTKGPYLRLGAEPSATRPLDNDHDCAEKMVPAFWYFTNFPRTSKHWVRMGCKGCAFLMNAGGHEWMAKGFQDGAITLESSTTKQRLSGGWWLSEVFAEAKMILFTENLHIISTERNNLITFFYCTVLRLTCLKCQTCHLSIRQLFETLLKINHPFLHLFITISNSSSDKYGTHQQLWFIKNTHFKYF